MAVFFCERCGQKCEMIPVYKASKFAGVCRSTIYYWIDREWIHWNTLASGRRLICANSLVHASCESKGVVPSDGFVRAS